LATWSMDNARGEIDSFTQFVSAACNLVDHKMFLDYASAARNGMSVFPLDDAVEQAYQSISWWEDAKTVDSKPGKIYVTETKSPAFVSFDFHSPEGHLRFVFNKLVAQTAKNRCFIEFIPNRGRRYPLEKVMHVLGEPTELSVNYTGKSVTTGMGLR